MNLDCQSRDVTDKRVPTTFQKRVHLNRTGALKYAPRTMRNEGIAASIEYDADGFKQVRGNLIFVAGSSDVKSARELAEDGIKKALFDFGESSNLESYSWDTDEGVTSSGFDQRRSMQKNLPRPAAENCRGLICIFGGRIGLPLETDFPIGVVADIERWLQPQHGFRLEPKWPDDPQERRRLLEDGAYPLTGTVFEFLDARGAGKPVWLSLLADRSITVDDRDVILHAEYLAHLTAGRGIETQRAIADTVYFEQTQGLCNFMCALAKAGISQNPTPPNQKLTRLVYGFVSAQVASRARDRNPYRYLECYDIDDGDDFHGRRDFVALAVEHLDQGFSGSTRPPALRIVGPSGCGKSSVLRAGILRELQSVELRGRNLCLAFRPEDFRDASGRAMPVIGTLLDLICMHTDLELSPRALARVRWAGTAAPAAAVELLQQALELSPTSTPRRLIIGIDQFEEILDALGGIEEPDSWRPLVAFINLAVQSRMIGVIYTLESSRTDAHARLALGPGFEDSMELPLDESNTFIHSIIGVPFRHAGLALSVDVVEEIKKEFTRVRSPERRDAYDAALPLLALKLSQLFELVRVHFESHLPAATRKEAHKSVTRSSKDAEREGGISQADLAAKGIALNFDSVISQQANWAWRDANESNEIEKHELNGFLQPLVGLESNNLQLKVAANDQSALTARFLDANLLIPVGKGQVRLVHEAVITRWPAARQWFEERKQFLALDQKLRAAATFWRANDCASFIASLQQIDEAAEILEAYSSNWGMAPTRDTPEDAPLKAYCSAVFQQSNTPMQAVAGIYPDRRGSHTTLAAKYGFTELLSKFHGLDAGCLDRPNPHSTSGRRALQFAAIAHRQTVDFLLAQAVDPISKDNEGWSAIYWPIQSGHMGIFSTLIERIERANPSSGESLEKVLMLPGDQTLLHFCGSYNRREMAMLLIERYGFRTDAKDSDQWTPMHSAAFAGAVEAFEYFRVFDSNSKKLEGQALALRLAASHGKITIVSTILEGSNAKKLARLGDDNKDTPLHHAARNGHAACLTALLPFSDPNEINGQGSSSLHLAAQGADPSSPTDQIDHARIAGVVASLLRDPQTNPNTRDSRGRTALAFAQRVPSAQRLLLEDPRFDLRAPFEPGGNPSYDVAAKLGLWSVVERLLAQYEQPKDAARVSPNDRLLHCMITRNAPKQLIERMLKVVTDATLNARDSDDKTALGVAIDEEKWALVDLLLDTGRFDLARGSQELLGPLDAALEGDAPASTVERILAIRPTLLTEIDGVGWTPIQRASAHQNAKLIERLIELTKNRVELWDEPDRHGRRPSDLRHPDHRSSLPGSEVGRAWPTARTWDTGVSWVTLSLSERTDLVDKLTPELSELMPSPESEAAVGALSFYPRGVQLLRISDPNWRNKRARLYFLCVGDEYLRLNGSSAPIHDMNAKLVDGSSVLSLTPETALDYLRFFCFFVHGEDGPFLVIESEAAPELRAALGDATQAKIRGAAHPAWFGSETEQAFFVAASILYGDDIFTADLSVKKNGEITMLDDEPLANLKDSDPSHLLGGVLDSPIA